MSAKSISDNVRTMNDPNFLLTKDFFPSSTAVRSLSLVLDSVTNFC
jgi:hypothetical protein